MKDMMREKSSNTPGKKDVSISILLTHYTGDILRKYIKSFGALKYKERNFVKTIEHYVTKSKSHRVLSISGLKGTGKTTGILQGLYKLNRFEDIVYISVQADSNPEATDIKQFIDNNYFNKPIIVIDNITNANGIIDNISFLSDEYASSGKKVIISGTDSLAIELCIKNSLYQKNINKKVTFISYEESRRILDLSLSEYLQFGSLFLEDGLKDLSSTHNYIQSAIIDNIRNTIDRNKNSTQLTDIKNINAIDIRTIVFKLLYSIIYNQLSDKYVKSTEHYDVTFSIFDVKSLKNNGLDSLNDLIKQHIEINDSLVVTNEQIKTILEYMVNIGILVKACNFCNTKEEKYYLTNSSITNQIMKTIINAIFQDRFQNLQSNLFEVSMMTHFIKNASEKGKYLYYYRDDTTKELYLILREELYPGKPYKDKIELYEIKPTDKPDLAMLSIKCFNTIDKNQYFNNIVKAEEIVKKLISKNNQPQLISTKDVLSIK